MGSNRGTVFGLALAVCLAAVACGDDSSSAAPSYAGQTKSVMVEAGKAALLEVGAVKLDVPEGAVAADTEVTVDVSAKTGKPEASKIAIDVYDFGPDGTTFDKGVKLEFDLKGVNVGKGKKAQVAWLEDGKWKPLPTSVKNGKASAETTHFTPFTVIIVVDSSQQVGGMCGDDVAPCGGNLVGTWEYTTACLNLPPAFGGDGEENPFEACSVQPVARYDIDISGEATFGADGSFRAEQTQSITGGIVISGACLDEIAQQSGGTSITCEQFGGVQDGRDCIVGGEETDPETETTIGTYTTEGTVLTVIEEGYEPDPTDPDPGQEYCVEGDTLTIHIRDEEGLDIMITGRRK
jgi:hypothetical protein